MMNPTISLDEPWASLVAAGIKSIETRSWATKHRGLIFIHATVKSFGFNSERADLLRDNLTLHDYRRLSRHLSVQSHGKAHAKKYPQASSDPELWPNYMPGRVLAVATLVDCVPIIEGCADFDTPALVIDAETPPTKNRPAGDATLSLITEDSDTDVTAEWPWGCYEPGRFAWVLKHVRPLDVVKYARGRQRVWDWKDGPFQPIEPPRENPYL